MRKHYMSRSQTRSMSVDYPIGDPTGGAAYGEFNDPVTAFVGDSLFAGAADAAASDIVGSAALGSMDAAIPATVGGIAGDAATTAAASSLPTAALINAGGSLAGGLISASGAQNAANTQAASAANAQAQQKAMFDIQNAQQAAGRGAGYQSLNQIRSMLPSQYTQYNELGQPTGTATGQDYLTHQFNAQDFLNNVDPGYQFRLQQGQLANMAAANQAGGLIGGNALKGLQDYTQGAASQEYGNAFNRYQAQRTNIYNTLAGIAGIGQTAQGQANQLGQNYANNQTGLITGAGAAQAAGQVGAANAISGGLQGAGSSYMLSQLLKNNGVA